MPGADRTDKRNLALFKSVLINKDLGGVMEKTFTIPYEAWCKDEAEWSITAMDNTGFKLDCKYGIITLSDRYGNGICDFMASDISKCIGNLN